MAYVYEFFLAFVLSPPRLIPEDHIVVPSEMKSALSDGTVLHKVPSFSIGFLVWIEQRISKSYVMLSFVLLGFCFLTLLRFCLSKCSPIVLDMEAYLLFALLRTFPLNLLQLSQ